MTVDPNAATQSWPSPEPERRPGAARYLIPALVAAAVAVALGAYGKVHDPAGTAFNLAGFSSTGAVKSWLATVAFFFALVQLVSALMVYGKLPGPSWSATAHRWSGRVAFLVAVPVAVHCLYALGFQSYESRVLWHSLLGCFFFGVFSAKMLLLRSERLPGWLLPIVGGLVFSALTILWLTSALWFFRTFGVTT
ncbi:MULTISPECIES: DUF6529 family protein [Streptomyces]|uniref:Uncharacterized protein n=1 Tax=Streptomyces sviceus (strain ATCC 29083 / DSM 924 / JCM 4929 / NBRC 13980 / NCIMB 11184 / NRRL 5439 / UC 5370) TaxID=463191 RepID=B5I0K5_STRX2|nr:MULTISPECIES: DUF6529 family protein [Streptomyces]EDY58610.1 conserved hypothetical protein [Streptomyces sviceus ATCC 29083]MYT04870.1 hypothetical protein [Streptomyces sp. SID5470]